MSIHHLNVDGIGAVELTVGERGAGHPILLLHGGAGPQSVAAFAELLAGTQPARLITPTHPGFGGTPRPPALTTIAGLARTYAALLAELGLAGVTVVGNSVGGWIAAELALVAPERVGSLVIVDAAGIDVPGHPVADVFSLSIDERTRLSYHDPARFRIDVAALPPAQRALMAANMQTLALYGGNMMDSSLRARLAAIAAPTLVLWGESDGIVDPVYGRAYADAIPGARFELLPATGHVPQLETPEQLARALWPFVAAHAPQSA